MFCKGVTLILLLKELFFCRRNVLSISGSDLFNIVEKRFNIECVVFVSTVFFILS